MKCPKCGMIINEDLMFCPGCKSRVDSVVTYEEPDFIHNDMSVYDPYEDDGADYIVEDEYYDEVTSYRKSSAKKKASDTWLTVLIAVGLGIIVTVAAAFIIIGSQSREGGSEGNTHSCALCSVKLDSDAKHCDECVSKYSCTICNKVAKDVKEGFCPDCAIEYTCVHCKNVDSTVKDRYCKKCAEELKCKTKDCDAIVEKGFYCNECVDNLIDEEYGKICFVCDSPLKNAEIFLIDTYGIAYCEDCDTGKYCTNCNGYLDEASTDDVCLYCAQYFCYICEDILEQGEVAVTDKNGRYYCASCDTNHYCNNCGAPIKSSRTKCKSCGQ